MSSKSASDSALLPCARRGNAPWSLAARLAAGFGLAAFGLLLFASSLMYLMLAGSLDREDTQYLAEKIAALESLLREHANDIPVLQAELNRESQPHFYAPVLMRVYDGKGGFVAETQAMTDVLPRAVFPKPLMFRVNPLRGVDFDSPAGRAFRLVSAQLAGGSPDAPGHVLQAALDRTEEERLLSKYRTWLWLELGLGLVVSIVVGYGIAHRGLRPIGRMAATMQSIGSATLYERVEPAGFPAELSVLAARFNAMLDRLEDAFDRLSRFSSDIAHELRTPINSVRGLVEVALSKARSPQERDELLGSCLGECQRLSRLIDNLLFLARAENPQAQINRQSLDVSQELNTVREFYKAAADECGIALDLDTHLGITANLDRLLLQRALGNLIENALAHTPRGGKIIIAARPVNGAVRIEISDSGCGIAPEHLGHLFERFHRIDASRSKNTGGVGLGLVIVKSIATLHGGNVEVASDVGTGTRFTLVLPCISKGWEKMTRM